MKKRLSVVIPVYNLSKIVIKTLNSLLSESIPADHYEIIIVDDGSSDDTKELLQVFQNSKRGNKLKVFNTIKKHGRGAARNLGIRNAYGEIIILLDGDIIVSRGFLTEHLKWHEKFPKENFAMVGHITWPPEINVTPFMYWLDHGGKQLDFDNLTHGKEIDYRFFYTGNASLKRRFLLNNGLFDEDFGRNLYDDLELAYRLSKNDLKIFYNKNAIGYHFHKTNPNNYAKRMIFVGKGARILFNKHPELKDEVSLSGFTFRTLLNQVFSPLFFIIGKVFRSQRWMGYFYNAKFFRCYMKGYSKE